MQRSPPLRRGTRSKVAGKEQQDGYADMKADPGMVLNYKAAEEVQPQPAAPQPDLLDFDGLSMDAPPAANAQVSPCIHFISYLTAWGVEPVVTHQTSWLESTGAVCVQVLSIYQSISHHACP